MAKNSKTSVLQYASQEIKTRRGEHNSIPGLISLAAWFIGCLALLLALLIGVTAVAFAELDPWQTEGGLLLLLCGALFIWLAIYLDRKYGNRMME